jgi:hypothetical protein
MPRLIALLALLGVAATAAPADRWHVVAANGVVLRIPSGWTRVQSAGDGNVVDPRTVLVVGTRGARPRPSQCQVAHYRVPAAGAVVVVVAWKNETSGGGRPPRSRRPLAAIRIRKPSFECYSGRGGAAQLSLGGRAFQVNVMVGGRASRARIDQALAVARSFDLSRR